MAAYSASVAGGGSSGTSNRSLAVTPAIGDLLVVFVSLSANTNATPTCSDGEPGGTYTRILQALWNASANNMACFVRDALSVSTNARTVTVASGSNTAGEIVIVRVTGMAKVGAAAVRSSGSQANQASGSTPAPVLSQSALTGNVTIAAVGGGDTTTDIATNWTERQDASQSSPTTCLAVMTRDTGFTGTTITYNSTEGAVYASMAIELDGSIDGTLSTTLVAVTSTATGTVDIFGTASSTLGAVTLASTGTLEIQGTLSSTLGAVTLAATGEGGASEILGTLSVTLDAVTSTAAGTLDIQGTLSATLGAVTSAATGTLEIQGVLSATLGAVTSTATGELERLGVLAQTLGAVTLASTATLDIQGTASVTIGAVTLASTGTVEIQGTASVTLGAVTLTAAGEGVTERLGVLAVTLGAVTLVATGGGVEREGTLAATLGAVTLAGHAVIEARPAPNNLSRSILAQSSAAAFQIRRRNDPRFSG